jgi:phosphonate transport system substrate-binding protein
MAPLALFGRRPDAGQGLQGIIFSGKHDQSVMGVNSGDYDAGAVASDVFHRMGERGQVKESDFRIIYRSQKFPTSSFAYAHDPIQSSSTRCSAAALRLPLPAGDAKAFDGADRFFPINYKTTWAVVGTWPRARVAASTRPRTKRKRQGRRLRRPKEVTRRGIQSRRIQSLDSRSFGN